MVHKIFKNKLIYAGSSSAVNGAIFILTQVGVVSMSNPITIPISIFCGGVSLGLLVAFASEKKKISAKDKEKIKQAVQEVYNGIHSNPPYGNEAIMLPKSPVEPLETHRSVEIDGEEYEVRFVGE